MAGFLPGRLDAPALPKVLFTQAARPPGELVAKRKYHSQPALSRPYPGPVKAAYA